MYYIHTVKKSYREELQEDTQSPTPPSDGKVGYSREEVLQMRGGAERGLARETWGQDAGLDGRVKWLRAWHRVGRLVSCEPCSPRYLSPGCLRPFLLVPVGQLAPSTLPSLNSHLSSRLPLSNRVNTFLCYCTGQHSSDFLAAGTPHVLLLEPTPSLSYFSSICARNMPTRISLDIFS